MLYGKNKVVYFPEIKSTTHKSVSLHDNLAKYLAPEWYESKRGDDLRLHDKQQMDMFHIGAVIGEVFLNGSFLFSDTTVAFYKDPWPIYDYVYSKFSKLKRQEFDKLGPIIAFISDLCHPDPLQRKELKESINEYRDLIPLAFT